MRQCPCHDYVLDHRGIADRLGVVEGSALRPGAESADEGVAVPVLNDRQSWRRSSRKLG
jgi:hypothetical protein